jgi:cytochrome P450
VREQFLKIAGQMLPPVDTLLTADPPTHKKYRSQVDRVFSAGNVRKMEPYVQQIIDESIDGFIYQGEVEFIQAFSLPVPLRIISDRLGVAAQRARDALASGAAGRALVALARIFHQ